MDTINLGARTLEQPVAGFPSIPGYEIIKALDRGGQGHVFQAIHLADARKVAIKLIRPDRLGDASARARFEQESRTLALLDHLSIVRVIDKGELPGRELWFATEYVSGLPINEHVGRLDGRMLESGIAGTPGPFPLCKVLELFVQVCHAIQAAHNVGVLHRDLKPSNILVDDEGRPHVLDFGLAKHPETTDATLITLTGQFLGSPAWCSPEQIEARPSAIDVRSDVYSLGVILYNLLTGEFPYPVDQPLADLFDAIRRCEPTVPSAHAVFIDDDLETIILKALAKERERRYQSVRELGDDVQRYLCGEPIQAKGDGLAYIAGKFMRRHPVLTSVIGAVFALSLVYGATLTVLYRRATSAEAHAVAKTAEARQKFRMARDTAALIISQISKGLEHLPGATETRTRLLNEAFAQFEALAKESSDDPGLLADLATAQKQLSDIAYDLGDTAKCEANRRAALEIRHRLLTATPSDPDCQEALSIATVVLGDVLIDLGRKDEAYRLYDDAMTIDQGLVVRYPDNPTYLDNLAWSYERAGARAGAANDHVLELDLKRKRYTISQRLVAMQPKNLSRLYSLCGSYMNLAAIEADRSKRYEGYLNASQIGETLVAREPHNDQYMHYFVMSQLALARFELDMGKQTESRERVDRATAVSLRFSGAEPGKLLNQESLAQCLMLRSDLRHESGDLDAAEADMRELGKLWLGQLLLKPNQTALYERVGHAVAHLLMLVSDPRSKDHTHQETWALIHRALRYLPRDLTLMDSTSDAILKEYRRTHPESAARVSAAILPG